eukprot:TRINITY_DN670_c0_g1_i4.p1 TRINITY_DN670_c0_g1~~TRINITY_DN670_c0_g1_i4.p1  ORF type:complete len:131 (+),score=8.00 TRINITY_DN670_c0_g1_i4:224-616(+)
MMKPRRSRSPSMSMSSSCPSKVKLTVVYPWLPVGKQTVNYNDVTVGKELIQDTKFKPSDIVAARTVSIILMTFTSATCKVTLSQGEQKYDNTFLEDAASMAMGILLAIIIGAVVSCICVIVWIVYMCKKS